MSEEIKSLKNYISTTKNEIFTTFKIETISNLIIYYEDLQQKVEQLEKENEATLKNYGNLVKEWNQLENIRKEAIEYIGKHTIMNFKKVGLSKDIVARIVVTDLLNILNKGSENNELD